MIQQSMFLETLATVRKRIQQVRERKATIGEENTKATLIEPVFSALGWNLLEMDEVRREYRRKPQDNPVDYALLLNRTECLFVEAKSLEKDLRDHKWVTQNLTYTTGAGVQWCVLTNGDEYRIYNAHAPVAAEERLFRSVRISETESKFLVGTLLLLSKDMMRGSLLDDLWKAHFVDRKVRLALETMLAQPDHGMERLIQKKVGALSATDIRASLKRAKIRIDFPEPSVSVGPEKGEPAQDDGARKKGATSRHEAGKKARETTKVMADATLDSLITVGLVKPPFEMEREYKGVHVTAVIQQNGKVVFAGKAYDSLSTAGGMARKQVVGAPPNRPYPQTNGWQFWQYRDEHGELHAVEQLRKRYLERGREAGM
ncbi:MAG: type I restriction endonuclease [Acidobacteria bacterium]|nr:type I restriction endonuclease [Acidobacteriota bacterium]